MYVGMCIILDLLTVLHLSARSKLELHLHILLDCNHTPFQTCLDRASLMKDLVAFCNASKDKALLAAGMLVGCVSPMVAALDINPASGHVSHASG